MRFRYDLRLYDSDKNLCRCLDLYCTRYQADKCFYNLADAFIGSRYSMLELVLVGDDVSDSVLLTAVNRMVCYV